MFPLCVCVGRASVLPAHLLAPILFLCFFSPLGRVCACVGLWASIRARRYADSASRASFDFIPQSSTIHCPLSTLPSCSLFTFPSPDRIHQTIPNIPHRFPSYQSHSNVHFYSSIWNEKDGHLFRPPPHSHRHTSICRDMQHLQLTVHFNLFSRDWERRKIGWTMHMLARSFMLAPINYFLSSFYYC